MYTRRRGERQLRLGLDLLVPAVASQSRRSSRRPRRANSSTEARATRPASAKSELSRAQRNASPGLPPSCSYQAAARARHSRARSGSRALQLRAEKLREQTVIPVRTTVIVERDHERVLGLQLGERLGRVRHSEGCIAQLSRHLGQHGGREQESTPFLRLLVEDDLDQIVGDLALVAGDRLLPRRRLMADSSSAWNERAIPAGHPSVRSPMTSSASSDRSIPRVAAISLISPGSKARSFALISTRFPVRRLRARGRWSSVRVTSVTCVPGVMPSRRRSSTSRLPASVSSCASSRTSSIGESRSSSRVTAGRTKSRMRGLGAASSASSSGATGSSLSSACAIELRNARRIVVAPVEVHPDHGPLRALAPLAGQSRLPVAGRRRDQGYRSIVRQRRPGEASRARSTAPARMGAGSNFEARPSQGSRRRLLIRQPTDGASIRSRQRDPERTAAFGRVRPGTPTIACCGARRVGRACSGSCSSATSRSLQSGRPAGDLGRIPEVADCRQALRPAGS